MLKRKDANNGAEINEFILEKGGNLQNEKETFSWIFGEIKNNIMFIKSKVLWKVIIEMKNRVSEITSQKKQLNIEFWTLSESQTKRWKGDVTEEYGSTERQGAPLRQFPFRCKSLHRMIYPVPSKKIKSDPHSE